LILAKHKYLLLVFVVITLQTRRVEAQAGYITGDFHQHTTYTDGSYSFGMMMEMNNHFGLDWWANSEHGGLFPLNDSTMWRWESIKDWSFKDLLFWRSAFPTKILIQGLEMNVPGHEHASVAILGEQFDGDQSNANAIAQFEYRFDNNDNDLSDPFNWLKSTSVGHEKAKDALRWLVANHPQDSWFILNHPERFDGLWTINEVRDLNTIAPDVFFGFTSIPGHQKYAIRGVYSSAYTYHGHATFGGTGEMAAKVGGYWDALLSEGRRFWLYANSDCHNAEDAGMDFFPGEYQKNYTWVADKHNPQAIVDGLRSGNTYVVMGDLIDSLYFNIGDAAMGGVYGTDMDSATISIILHDPVGKNNNHYSDDTVPMLDHVDLIEGVVSGFCKEADVENYKRDSVSTTKVIARFSGMDEVDSTGIATQVWHDKGEGWKEINFKVALIPGKKLYFRLRGTNKGVNEPGETDRCGNPLEDVEGSNSAAVAFSDLWFYSNPVFVESLQNVSTKPVYAKQWNAFVEPTERMLWVTFKKPYSGLLEAFDVAGKRVLIKELVNEWNFKTSVRNLPVGVYTLLIDGFSQKICN